MRTLLQRFLALESASGIILFLAAVVAMVWVNSPFAASYQSFTSESLFLINDVFMAIFFLVVGLELKRGYLEGPLSQFSQVLLPAAGAVGGMLLPALIYILININNPEALRGWSTPVATDIAFALGVLSFVGRRVPASLKLFLLALAIFDDLGAITIIALFYTKDISLVCFLLSGVILLGLYLLNRFSVRSLSSYIFLGVLLWVCLLKGGVHPTIGGVLLALAIPGDRYAAQKPSLLTRLENTLHPWAAFVIMPLFALANAGFSLSGLSINSLLDGVALGIILGLFVGKQLGVMGFVWAFIRAGYARLPENATWMQLYGISLLCGIGFTMSLFLGTLSFQQNNVYLSEVRLGVIVGSMLSGLAGALVLLIARPKNRKENGIG